MAYRKPGITVTQEFAGLVPALAAFNLPSVSVGPAYQLVDNDEVGIYSGSQTAYLYDSLIGGSIVDLALLDPKEKFPASKKPMTALMRNTILEVAASAADGKGVGAAFSDSVTGSFATAQIGDLIKIVPSLALTIITPQTGGAIPNTAGERNQLTKIGAFVNAKIGDIVGITSGTNATVADYPILAVLSDDLVLVTGEINDGVGPTTDAAFTLIGDRGVENEGTHRVKTVTDANNVILESTLTEDESLISYSVIREANTVEIARVTSLLENGFLPSEGSIDLPGSSILQESGLPIIGGDFEVSYRALRIDMASEVKEYKAIEDIEAAFGVGQITPANPLAFALQVMLQNTVTAVNGLGLSADFTVDETLAFTKAAGKLSLTEMYAIAVLSQNGSVHTLFKNHVQQLSLPEKKKERVALINSKLIEKSTLQASSTTSADLLSARTIVPTSINADAVSTSPTVLTDTTPDKFQNVEAGDKVKILAGTNANIGTFDVISVDDLNNLTLSAAIISGGTSSDFQYVIIRPDGLDVGGTTIYDRNANFLSNGVAAGHYVDISLPTGLVGRFKIGTITSEKELELSVAIPGIITHQNPLTYKVDRDLSTGEMAESVKGYSEAIGSRKVAHCWPDIVKMTFGSDVIDLPGYYLGSAVAALTTGLPTQQGFTNLAVSGFLGYEHGLGFFDDDELDVIADGGTFIFNQDGEALPLYVRHQLTTDRSAIKFQEYSVTKNVDFIAKFIRGSFAKYTGQWNIIDTTTDSLKTTASASIGFLRDKTKQPKIGGVIRSGSLTQLVESDVEIDTMLMKFGFSIPIPLNHIDIVIAV